MDPYLEAPSIWPDVHQSLITYARDSLIPQVRPRYWVRMGERVFVSEPSRGVYPDVIITGRPPRPPASRSAGGVAVAEALDTPFTVIVPPAVIREIYLEILDPRSGHVITVIEFLSPTNKAIGEGRELYLQKQLQVLESDANLVEVDLLRRGESTAAIPADGLYAYQPYDYLVCISLPANRGEFRIIPRTVRDPLPRVGVPLRPGEPNVALDLPALLARAYENGAYDEMINYARDPDPPFGEPDATWVRQIARARIMANESLQPAPATEPHGEA
jgi:hypothetical protein